MLISVLAAAALAQATPAADSIDFDVRCMLIMGAIRASTTDENMRTAATSASLFFFGRVDSRLSAAELEARAMQQASTLNGVDRTALAQECGTFMGQRGQILSEIGDRMIQRGAQEGANRR